MADSTAGAEKKEGPGASCSARKGVMQRQKDEGMSKGRAEEHLPRPPPGPKADRSKQQNT